MEYLIKMAGPKQRFVSKTPDAALLIIRVIQTKESRAAKVFFFIGNGSLAI